MYQHKKLQIQITSQQIRAIRDDGTYEEYYYDSSRHLLSAEATDYGYDAEENRYGTYDRTTGKESLYTYADTPYGTQLVISETSTGEEQTYVYGNGLISSTDRYGRTAVYHYDYRGSTTSLTDTEGNIIAAYSYGTYGDCTKEEVTYTSEIFSQDEEVDTIFRYNGRDGVITDSNGMYYIRSRYYSPYLMRFINADVYTGSIENSPTLNRYAYAIGRCVMDFNSIINDVNSKEDFMNFLTQLRLDKQQKSEEWENDEITSYLEGICSWVDDMEGYFDNMHIEMPTDIDWRFIATLFYVGKIYE